MKPEEFDVLLKQKFEQNDFEYSPRNWDKLAEELDGHNKKRGLLLWWVPLMGLAASVAMAFGVTTVLKDGGRADKNLRNNYALIEHISKTDAIQEIKTTADAPRQQPAHVYHYAQNIINSRNQISVADNSGDAKISMANVLAYHPAAMQQKTILEAILNTEPVAKKKKTPQKSEPVYTFKESRDPVKKNAKSSIILLGGVNYSNLSTGYTVGATARRRLNGKLFVESDIAFTGTNNTQKTLYLEKVQSGGSSGSAVLSASNARTINAKSTNSPASPVTPPAEQDVIKSANEQYNLYYAQVTPSIGYQVMKHLSVGVGPDFQQMLVDNRPAPSTVDRGNITEAPMFDVGMMGKIECTITGNVKAAVSYREGINNIITPNNSFIDRNYLQFQIKYAIFNK